MASLRARRRFHLLEWLRKSSLPYLSSLVIIAMLAGWSNYLSPLLFPDGLTFKGQTLAVVLPFVFFPISLILWWIYRGARTKSRSLVVFLVGLGASWVLHMVLLRTHGDQNNHLVWLFIPILVMILLKTPTYGEAWQAILVFAWSAIVILLATRALEIVGVLPLYHIEQWIIDYEKSRYWLPLSGYLGLEGRWAGPFGYNSKTGFISTLLILIGLARWRLIRSTVFILIGVLGVLLTGGRGAALALATGLLILLVFAPGGPVSRIPIVIRASAAVLAVSGVGLYFVLSPNATSGRFGPGGIWEGFINLWQTSPWIGVGQTGILADPRAGMAMEAHSLYLQELTRSGVLGFAFQFAVIGLGLGIVSVAAYRGLPWPLALLSSYYAASLTEVFQDGWLQQSTYSLLILVCVLAAAGWLEGHNGAMRLGTRKQGSAA